MTNQHKQQLEKIAGAALLATAAVQNAKPADALVHLRQATEWAEALTQELPGEVQRSAKAECERIGQELSANLPPGWDATVIVSKRGEEAAVYHSSAPAVEASRVIRGMWAYLEEVHTRLLPESSRSG